MRKKALLSDDVQQEIENILGTAVLSDRFLSVLSFKDFTDVDLIDLRRLWNENGLLCLDYLEFLLRDSFSLRVLMSFGVMVLEQGLSVSDWIEKSPVAPVPVG